MKNKAEDKKNKTPDNKDYNPNQAQDITKPKFNSATEYRESSELPQIEDLNQENQKLSELKETKVGQNITYMPKNDNSLHGKKTKPDLGNGKRDDKRKKRRLSVPNHRRSKGKIRFYIHK